MTDTQGAAKPRRGRVALAFVMAPVVSSVTFLVPMIFPVFLDLLDPSADASDMLKFHLAVLKIAMFVALVIAFGATIIVGLPTYCLLRKSEALTPTLSALTGGFVALTAAVLALLGSQGSSSGVIDLANLMAQVFGCGLIGGLVFWLCAFWRGPAFMRNVRV